MSKVIPEPNIEEFHAHLAVLVWDFSLACFPLLFLLTEERKDAHGPDFQIISNQASAYQFLSKAHMIFGTEG